MTKFFGPIGFGETIETKPGVYEDVITERNYVGDVQRSSRQEHAADKVNSDISVNNVISILSDQYANEHLFAIRYILWSGALWTVTDAELQSPRLLLRLGGVYNGPRPAPAADTP
jgi:hypothetical protein